MQMPGRKFSGGSQYRYGFNGKENDNEVKGDGNQQDYGMRIYDPRLGRFLSVDPLTKDYPHYTPYSYAGNKPIKFIDLDGLEEGKNLGDYTFQDLMNWFYKPSNPLADDGFVHKAGYAINTNFNFIYNGWVLVTNKDFNPSNVAPMTRMDAATNMVTQITIGKSTGKLLKPSAPAALEKQMTQNAAAMNKGAVKPQEPSTNNPNRGKGTALEKQNHSAAGQFESGAEGAVSDIATKKRLVPTLKYDNPNPNGYNFIKFDSDIGGLNFIDRKINVTGFPKSIDQIQRAAEALSQNPGATLRYEVPLNKVEAMQNLLRKAGQFLNPNITVVGIK